MTNQGPHSTFMNSAVSLSRKNVRDGVGGPFGAVIVKEGTVIAQGTNLVPSTNDPTAHAEIVAIRAACRVLNTFHLEGCTLYTSCEPCPMCLGAIYWARLDSVYFANTRSDAAAIGFDDEFLYRELATGLNDRKIPILRIEHPEALKIFREWEQLESKIRY